MSAATVSLYATNQSNTHFRTWGGGISAQLAAMGLVQTADTGQINWTTIAAPTGVGIVGYEIWRFDDALQSTAPVFFKLEYGGASSFGGAPALALTVGAGSNGSGTLTGTLSTRVALDGGSEITTAMSCYFSGDTNRCTLALWIGTPAVAAASMILSLERTVDVAGVVTDEGVHIVTKGASGAWKQESWSCTTGPMASQETSLGCFGPSVGTGASGTSTAVYPVYLTKGVFLLPGLNLLGCFEANFTALSTVAFTYYGASHTYLTLPAAMMGTPVARAASGSTVMMRYE